MIILFFLAILILASIAGYIQWMYANANYPTSWQWKAVLFFSGFAVISIAAWFMPKPGLTILEQTLLILGGGVFSGYCTLTLLPQKMQAIIPKKE